MKKLSLIFLASAFVSLTASAQTVQGVVTSVISEGLHQGQGCSVEIGLYGQLHFDVMATKGSEHVGFNYGLGSKVEKIDRTSQELNFVVINYPNDQYSSIYRYTLLVDNKKVTVREESKGLFGWGSKREIVCTVN